MEFYRVDRLFFKGDKETHSIQLFDSLDEARKRYFNIIATDLNDPDITFQQADIVDANGMMLECRVFDRTPKPEPEPETSEEE